MAADRVEDIDQLLDSWNPLEEHYYSPLNTLSTNDLVNPFAKSTAQTNNSTTTSKYPKKRPTDIKIGGLEICGRFSRFGCCIDGDYCSKKHISGEALERIYRMHLESEMLNQRIVFTMSDIEPQNVPINPSSLIMCEITMIKSARSFYVICPFEFKNFQCFSPEDVEVYLTRLSKISIVKQRISALRSNLHNLLGHNYRLDNIKDKVNIGQVVACKLDNNTFARGLVIDQTVDDANIDMYTVHLIDIGQEVELDRQAIHDLPKYFISIPPIALHCSLNGIPDCKVQAVTEKLRDTVLKNNLFFARLVHQSQFDEMIYCDLYSLKDRGNILVLIKKMLNI